MFQNPTTLWIEILVITLVISFLTIVIGVYIYKKIHHLPTGECAYCKSTKKNRLVDDYHKQYRK